MKKHWFYIVNFFCLSMGSYFLYYLLVQDSILHVSISDILEWASHSTKHQHLLVIGFLPIYIGLIVFGAAILIIYLRSSICPLLYQNIQRWLQLERKS